MFNVEDFEVGDYVAVQIINKKGDRNLDGRVLRGKVKEIVLSHRMARLESGWCVHEKDRLLEHITPADVEETRYEESPCQGERKYMRSKKQPPPGMKWDQCTGFAVPDTGKMRSDLEALAVDIQELANNPQGCTCPNNGGGDCGWCLIIARAKADAEVYLPKETDQCPLKR